MTISNFENLKLKDAEEPEITELISEIGTEEDIDNFLRAATEDNNNNAVNQLFELVSEVGIDWDPVEFMIRENDFRLIEMADEYGYYPSLDQMLTIVNVAEFFDAVNVFKTYLKGLPDEEDLSEIFKVLDSNNDAFSLRGKFKRILNDNMSGIDISEITGEADVDDDNDYNGENFDYD